MDKQLVKPALATVEEAARFLCLGRSTVYQMIAAGSMPSVVLGSSRRLRWSDLERIVAEGGVGAQAQPTEPQPAA